MLMSFKCSNRRKIAIGHLRICFNAANTVLMCKIGIKYLYASRAVRAYAHVFRKRLGRALIRASALIRMNAVC